MSHPSLPADALGPISSFSPPVPPPFSLPPQSSISFSYSFSSSFSSSLSLFPRSYEPCKRVLSTFSYAVLSHHRLRPHTPPTPPSSPRSHSPLPPSNPFLNRPKVLLSSSSFSSSQLFLPLNLPSYDPPLPLLLLLLSSPPPPPSALKRSSCETLSRTM